MPEVLRNPRDGSTMRSTTQHAKSPLSESSTTTMQIRLARSPGSSGSSGSSESVIAGTIPWKASRTLLGVFNPPLRNRELYVYPKEQDIVDRILKEVEDGKNMTYKVRFQDGHTELAPLEFILALEQGATALERFDREGPEQSSEEEKDSDMQLRQAVKRTNLNEFVNPLTISLDGSDSDDRVTQSTQRRSRRGQASRGHSHISLSSDGDVSESGDSVDDLSTRRRNRQRKSAQKKNLQTIASTRSIRNRIVRREQTDQEEESSESDNDGMFLLRSDVLPSRKRKRDNNGQGVISRRSERATRNQDTMNEVGEDYTDESSPETGRPRPIPRPQGAREAFKDLPRNDPFRTRHIQQCDACGNGASVGPLIFCQGCVLTYHQGCLGTRTTREHLVTKIGDGDFVLQCRRCVNVPQKKDATAPNLAKCQSCNISGSSCTPFRDRKTPAQEQREREENRGHDPVTNVNPNLINNFMNVLFRCAKCFRCFHWHHLEPKSPHHMDLDRDDEETASERFHEYAQDWLCKTCSDHPHKVSTIVAWRPSDPDRYAPGYACEMVDEDDKEYLVKFEKQSYFRALWMKGAWLWAVTAPAMRKAFYKRESGPKMRTEDAIPEEYLRIDIILSVKFTSIVETKLEEIDRARVKEVKEALIKYKGLGYEDAVWEVVPTPDDGDRWRDFVVAYNDWVTGKYVHIPKSGPLKARLEKARAQPFTKLEKSEQPSNLTGGKLMDYQMEGLNWLYYQWYRRSNGILADEMGLGKTIQVIGFLATLVSDHTCFPFLVVVPNSTCANWRREIKQWVPDLRVVTYFGSAQARSMAYQYELYPEGRKSLACHIVVTSYEAAADESSRRFFKSVPWQGLVVDEGQRLKSDKSQLYEALNALKIPFRLLLTGTPLQNNTRELFNLMQFLDDTVNAESLEEEYAEMTKENISKLHDLIRPFILRRTKAQVLTFLPPMAQIIVPISMSVLQKRLYRSILQKNPELLKALFATNRNIKQSERANLSNILMQLRKCLCHPFVYSREIEERTDIAAVSHRNLVEASAKLQLLELLLPKLQERGHRVLIFSQFLDMLDVIEDFLDGMQMRYQRLDGSMGSILKQKRIDEFNAPDSPLFAFLLSTRAGGVGINLATADTVIILDPDFNPHQDIQAVARAHRIGQKKKVLCFQFMMRASAEERMFQIGRKKMALDHIVVESLDDEDIEEKDVESILRHGAAELFSDDTGDQDVKYDNAAIEKLLDRSQIENTRIGEDNSAESQFSFARVWVNDHLEETIDTAEEGDVPDPSAWETILKQRDKFAAEEAAARAATLGRGKRTRGAVVYGDTHGEVDDNAAAEPRSPETPVAPKRNRKKGNVNDSDTDFRADATDQESDDGESGPINPNELDLQNEPPKAIDLMDHGHPSPSKPKRNPVKDPFRRAQVAAPVLPPPSNFPYAPPPAFCPACNQQHIRGACPLKIAGPEYCGLCGLAHYGSGRFCPHINSETQVREMLEALRNSPEEKHLVQLAMKYLRGVKGTLVQTKKLKAQKAAQQQQQQHQQGSLPQVLMNQQAVPPQRAAAQIGSSMPQGEFISHHAPGQKEQTGVSVAPVAQMRQKDSAPVSGATRTNDDNNVASALLDYLKR